MIHITELTNEANQQLTLVGENNEKIVLRLNYKPTQQGWFFDIEYDLISFVLNGVRLTTAFNVLRQWKNILPFGIMVTHTSGIEPFFIDDFSEGRVNLYLLNFEELEAIEAGIEVTT